MKPLHELHYELGLNLKKEELNFRLLQTTKCGLQLLVSPFHTASQPYHCLALAQNGSCIQEEALTANHDIIFSSFSSKENMFNM